MDASIAIVIVGAMVAGFVQGLSGFAFALVAMSFWAWAVEPQLAATMAVFGGLAGQVVAAITVRRGFDWRLLAPFLVGGLAGIPLGVAIVPSLDVPLFKALLGAVLVTWCPVVLLANRIPRVRFGGAVADGVAGFGGGVFGGIAGFSGAIPTLWCTLRQFERDRQRSVIQNFNLAILAVTAVTLLGAGRVTREAVPMLALVLPAMLVPSLLGARVYLGINDATFRRVVLVCLTASGVALLASSAPVLLGRI